MLDSLKDNAQAVDDALALTGYVLAIGSGAFAVVLKGSKSKKFWNYILIRKIHIH